MRAPSARALLALGSLAIAAPARPCSICTAGDPLIAASDAPSQAGELRLGLEGEWLDASAGSDLAAGARERVTQQTARLMGVYGPSERLNLVVTVPWVRKTSELSGGGLQSRAVRDGPGDVELGARWFAWRHTDWGMGRRHAVALSIGASTPTGEANAREAGVRLDDHAQVGTGGWGPYAGVLYRLEQLDWDLFASVTGRWRSENRWGFRYGAAVAWSLQGQWQVHDRFALGLGLDGREAAADREDGAVVENTGGLLLAAAPGAWFSLTDVLWISLRAQLPIATSLRGDQRVGPVVTAGIQWIAH